MEKAIQRAIQLWIELTGIDPNAKSFSMRDWNIYSMNEELKESFKLDPTGITTLMLLNYFAEYYFDNRNFSVNEMMKDFDKVMDYLNKTREFFLLINNDDFLRIELDFKNKILAAAKEYEMNSERVIKFIEDRGSLAFIRRDALRSMNTLKIHQFTHGVTDGAKPKYLKDIYMFWNINSLLAYIGNSKYSSISINLIKSADNYNSFFAFGIRNGSTISILTDTPKQAHPMAGQMSRRPDKDLANRYARNHFPYDLLDFKINELNSNIYFEKEKGLVSYQAEAINLKSIKDLSSDEIVWSIIMFDLIKEKFWDQDYKTPELSYTGEMLCNKNSLINSIKLKINNYIPLENSSLSKKDISYGNVDGVFQQRFEKNNIWIEKEYNYIVPEEVLNLVNTKDGVKLLQDYNGKKLLSVSEYKETNEIIKLIDLEGVDVTLFGSAEEMLSNQKWYARYNQAKIINKKLNQEYEEKKDEILNWYENKVKENLEFLYTRIAHKEFLTDVREDNSFNSGEKKSIKNILYVTTREKIDGNLFWNRGNVYLSDYDKSTKKHFCLKNGKEALLAAVFTPTNPQNLAALCGCVLEELPIPLQNWYSNKLYIGNYILDRIDPMEWVVKNPWSELQFKIVVFYSKSTYNGLRKINNLEPDKYWLDTKELPFIW